MDAREDLMQMHERRAPSYTARHFLNDVFSLGLFDVSDGERIIEQFVDRARWQSNAR